MSKDPRITAEMSIEDAILVMAEGNPGAMVAMAEMINDDPLEGFFNILYLDGLGIYGSKIYMLWSDCCHKDMDKLKETFKAFKEGRFTEEQIHENLNQVYGTPFI